MNSGGGETLQRVTASMGLSNYKGRVVLRRCPTPNCPTNGTSDKWEDTAATPIAFGGEGSMQ